MPIKFPRLQACAGLATLCLFAKLAIAQNATVTSPEPTTPHASFPDEPSGAALQPTPAPTARPDATTPQPSAPCEPSCSSGHECVQGQCVSTCNPPCPQGYRCGAGARCEALQPPARKQAASSREQIIREHEAELEQQTAHRHNGFYLRLGFTIGYATDTAKLDTWTTKSSGLGGFIDYAIGGTLIPGLVLAFGHHTVAVFSSSTTLNGQQLAGDPRSLFQVLGPLVDFYPNPRKGLHFSATVGYGSAGISNGTKERELDLGLGVAGGAGYDFWVGEQWSLGMMGRVMFINGASDEFGEHRAVVPMAAFSALYH